MIKTWKDALALAIAVIGTIVLFVLVVLSATRIVESYLAGLTWEPLGYWVLTMGFLVILMGIASFFRGMK